MFRWNRSRRWGLGIGVLHRGIAFVIALPAGEEFSEREGKIGVASHRVWLLAGWGLSGFPERIVKVYRRFGRGRKGRSHIMEGYDMDCMLVIVSLRWTAGEKTRRLGRVRFIQALG